MIHPGLNSTKFEGDFSQILSEKRTQDSYLRFPLWNRAEKNTPQKEMGEKYKKITLVQDKFRLE